MTLQPFVPVVTIEDEYEQNDDLIGLLGRL
jgi:hypothetical protein